MVPSSAGDRCLNLIREIHVAREFGLDFMPEMLSKLTNTLWYCVISRYTAVCSFFLLVC